MTAVRCHLIHLYRSCVVIISGGCAVFMHLKPSTCCFDTLPTSFQKYIFCCLAMSLLQMWKIVLWRGFIFYSSPKVSENCRLKLWFMKGLILQSYFIFNTTEHSGVEIWREKKSEETRSTSSKPICPWLTENNGRNYKYFAAASCLGPSEWWTLFSELCVSSTMPSVNPLRCPIYLHICTHLYCTVCLETIAYLHYTRALTMCSPGQYKYLYFNFFIFLYK